MNELIEELFGKYSTEEELFDVHGFPYIIDVVHLASFKQAIQTACQAQRNACARVYERDYIERGGYNIHDYIVDAEIERCDYE